MEVLRRIHETALASPGRAAMIYNGEPVDYATFWRLIVRCRDQLGPQLAPPGLAVIGVENLRAAWILTLALRSLGFDTAAVRQARQAAVFDPAEVTAFVSLASTPLAGFEPPPGTPWLQLEDPASAFQDHGGPLPPLPEVKKAGGHILLTSGTTGEAKRVRRPGTAAGGPTADMLAQRAQLSGGPGAKAAEAVVNVWDLGLWTAMGYSRPLVAWLEGATVVLCQDPDPAKVFQTPGITHTMATPWHVTRLLAQPEDAFAPQPQMQLDVNGGALTPSQAREIRRRLTPNLMITLGSTETGLWARTQVATDEDLHWYALIPERVVQVVDDSGEPVPDGTLGRLRVRPRDTDARGYQGAADASAAHFQGDWFYPGDLAMLDGKGRIALLGRETDVVNVEGVKYPAAPWERALQDHLGCEGVCVLSGRWTDDIERLHVFIESRGVVTRAALEEAFRSVLWGFRDVQAHRVEALPRTPTGKVRRVDLARQLHAGAFPASPA